MAQWLEGWAVCSEGPQFEGLRVGEEVAVAHELGLVELVESCSLA